MVADSKSAFIDQTVVPGDVVLDLSSMSNHTIKLGQGLRQDGDVISVMKAGKLRFSKPNKYWVESSNKRYVPCVEDTVLGIVVDQKADNFLVDIKGPTLAFLPVLAFEGGSRRNKPKFEVKLNRVFAFLKMGVSSSFTNKQGLECHRTENMVKSAGISSEKVLLLLFSECRFFPFSELNIIYFPSQVGKLLYVRVVKANADMNPELSCTDVNGKAAEFGPLKDGYMFESSTGLSRMLLSSPTCPVLEALGKKLSFEIAIGLNGRVWVNAEAPSTVILVSNAIMTSESLTGVQQRIMVEKLMQRVQ
ncbi:hypothetical protein IFM89_034852 [Coptis chinensis]|uniref:Ribosomal RNA-processing protein 40 n=1 Tax=Coptis chinensis TaxID=261450 RepID=A0A835I6V1_9MAGN|nr:hypothetical protein IFM89_034852 [Coptis chinensis]